MTIINLILITFLGLWAFAYRYIFPKKKINLFYLLLLISVISIISIFRPGTYESGDFNIHIFRSMAFFDSLKEGHLMPSWAKNLNATYGYPLFIFNYTLPYYLISLLHLIGFSFIYSLKIFLAFSFIFSGIFMYFFSKKVFKNTLAAFISSVFYLFTPYHLISLHFKITIGELLIFTFLPISFLFVEQFISTKKNIYFFAGSTFLAFLILSHAVLGFFCLLLIFLYIIATKKISLRNTLSVIAIILFSLMLSLYNWTAPLIYKPYLFIQISPIKTVYFPKILELLYSPWRMGFLFQGPKGELSFLIGYVELFVLVTAIYLFSVKKIKYLNYLRFWTITTLVLFFLITPYSKFLWEQVYPIKGAGSHRLLILVGFSISVLAGYLSLIIKRKEWVYILIGAAIVSTILNWGHRRLIPEIDDSVLRNNLPKSTSQVEGHFYANSRWVDINHPWFSEIPKNRLEIGDKNAKIINVEDTSTLHAYEIVTGNNVNLKENTLYFPGWNAKIDNKPVRIWSDSKGLINLNFPKGKHKVEIFYTDVFLYKIAKFVSILSFLISISYIFYYLSKTIKKRLK